MSGGRNALNGVFGNPVVFGFTNAVAPLLASLSVGYVAWLLRGRFTDGGLAACRAGILAPVVLAALAVAAAARWRAKIPLWVSLAFAGAGIAYLVAYFKVGAGVMPDGVPDWMLSLSHVLVAVAGMMPMIFAGVWRLATVELPLAPKMDAALSLATVVAVPGGVFLTGSLLARFMKPYFWGAGFGVLLVPLLVACPLVLFLGLLRLMMWCQAGIGKVSGRHAWVAHALTAATALGLPLGGLWLNARIPFPADFQRWEVYAMTVLNALLLLLPAGRMPRAAWFARWLALPFTLYFFVVFLPFLPLAVLAVVLAGAGFLILAPTLLFWRHVTLLVESSRRLPAARPRKIALAAAASLVMPGMFMANAVLDRVALREILDFAFARDAAGDARLPVSERRAKRVVAGVLAFKNRAELPILSAVYNQVVFDGMMLPDARVEALCGMFGFETPGAGDGDFSRDMWGMVFGRGRLRRGFGRPQNNAAVSGGGVEVLATNGEQVVTLRLDITTPDAWAQEFRADITLPPATWVGGMRLKIDGAWEDAEIIERRAAEWVYNQIVGTRLDPAVLTLEDPEHGLLRVFPVSRDAPRALELTLIQPEGMSLPLQIGGATFDVPGKGVAGAVHGGGVLFRPRGQKPGYFDVDPAAGPGSLVIVDSSRAGITPARLPGLAGDGVFPPQYLLSANIETRTVSVAGLDLPNLAHDEAASMLLPNRYGLDAARALHQAAIFNRDKSLRIVLFGDHWEEALKKVPPLARRGVDAVLIVAGNGEKTVLEFDDMPGITPAETPPMDAVVIPENTRWAQGAKAWRRHLAFYENQSATRLWREAFHESVASGILLPSSSYIVVENEEQRKMLRVKQAGAVGAHQAFDFDEINPIPADAPPLWVLLAGFVSCVAVRRCLALNKKGRNARGF